MRAGPTLSLGYFGASEAATKAIPTAARDIRLSRSDGKWPAYFQNLLPEGHNRERLAAQRGCRADDEFELLAAAGHDLMGAIEVEPVPAEEGIPDAVRHWHTALGLDVLEPGFVEFPVEDAAALPGVITKFSAVLKGRRYVVKRHGQAGSYILKLPTTRHPDLVANEFMGFQLCKAVGLNCANASVIFRADAELPEAVPFGDILAVERFDRGPAGQRIHMEEFAQVLRCEPKNKYGKDGVRPELAPLYDPVCITAFFEGVSEQDYGINRAIDKTVRAFTWDDLDAPLEQAKVTRRGRILQVAKSVAATAKADWQALLVAAPESMRRAIAERLAGGVALAAIPVAPAPLRAPPT